MGDQRPGPSRGAFVVVRSAAKPEEAARGLVVAVAEPEAVAVVSLDREPHNAYIVPFADVHPLPVDDRGCLSGSPLCSGLFPCPACTHAYAHVLASALTGVGSLDLDAVNQVLDRRYELLKKAREDARATLDQAREYLSRSNGHVAVEARPIEGPGRPATEATEPVTASAEPSPEAPQVVHNPEANPSTAGEKKARSGRRSRSRSAELPATTGTSEAAEADRGASPPEAAREDDAAT